MLLEPAEGIGGDIEDSAAPAKKDPGVLFANRSSVKSNVHIQVGEVLREPSRTE